MGALRQCSRDFASGALLNRLYDIGHCWQVSFNASDDLLVDVLEVVEGHPLFTEVLSEALRVEGKLEEHVHLGGLLAHHQLSVVLRGELIKTEKAQVSEDLVQSRIVAVRASKVPLKEYFSENLNANKMAYKLVISNSQQWMSI